MHCICQWVATKWQMMLTFCGCGARVCMHVICQVMKPLTSRSGSWRRSVHTHPPSLTRFHQQYLEVCVCVCAVIFVSASLWTVCVRACGLCSNISSFLESPKNLRHSVWVCVFVAVYAYVFMATSVSLWVCGCACVCVRTSTLAPSIYSLSWRTARVCVFWMYDETSHAQRHTRTMPHTHTVCLIN